MAGGSRKYAEHKFSRSESGIYATYLAFRTNLTFPTVRYFMQDHFSDAESFASGTYAVVPFKSK